MTVSVDYQFELGYATPLLMGPTTVYKITNIAGLDLPSVANADQRLVGNGAYAARDTLGGRTISLDFNFVSTSASGLITAIGVFLTAWQSTNTDITLTWKLPGMGTNRYANGRPRRVSAPLRYRETPRGFLSSAAADFFCPNPTIYLAGGTTPTVF